MQVVDIREFALSLPETTEAPHFDKASFRVRGKIFATIPPGDGFVHLFVDDHAVRALVGIDPAAFQELWWGKRLMGVRIHLARAERDLVLDMVEQAWRRIAPKGVIAQYDANRGGTG